jgi:hypothetical protein
MTAGRQLHSLGRQILRPKGASFGLKRIDSRRPDFASRGRQTLCGCRVACGSGGRRRRGDHHDHAASGCCAHWCVILPPVPASRCGTVCNPSATRVCDRSARRFARASRFELPVSLWLRRKHDDAAVQLQPAALHRMTAARWARRHRRRRACRWSDCASTIDPTTAPQPTTETRTARPHPSMPVDGVRVGDIAAARLPTQRRRRRRRRDARCVLHCRVTKEQQRWWSPQYRGGSGIDVAGASIHHGCASQHADDDGLG